MSDDTAEYQRLFESHLPAIAVRLRDLVADHLNGHANIDLVRARAKTPTSFAVKAARLDDTGEPVYSKPLTDIQDQLGVLVTVLYRDSVSEVWEELLRYFTRIEERSLAPDSPWEFGYFGRHGVAALPRDVIPNDVDPEEVPRFFEIQVKTLFQYAWSEANHDLGYKTSVELTDEQKRLLAFAAAQGWGADNAFGELRKQLAA